MTEIIVNPVGTVVEVVSDKGAVLVEAEVTIIETNDSGGGNSGQTTTTRKATWIVPAKILVRGTKRLKEYFCYEVGEKVIIISGDNEKETALSNLDDFHSIPASWYFAEDYSNFHFLMCYVVGSFYENDEDLPAKFEEVAILKFPDGSSVSYNFEDNELFADFKGDVTINGKGIYLNS